MESVNMDNVSTSTKNVSAPAPSPLRLINAPAVNQGATLQAVAVAGTFRTLVEIGTEQGVMAIERADALLSEAALYDVDCQEVADLAAEALTTLRTFVKATNEQRMTITRQLDADKQVILDAYKPAITKAQQADTLLCGRLSIWRDKLEAARLAQEAESRRLLAEQAAKIAAEIDAAVKVGDVATVMVKSVEAQLARSPVVVSANTKIAGLEYVDNWKMRVIDVSKVPREFLMVDEQKLNAQAKVTKGETNIAGCEAYNERYPKTAKRK